MHDHVETLLVAERRRGEACELEGIIVCREGRTVVLELGDGGWLTFEGTEFRAAINAPRESAQAHDGRPAAVPAVGRPRLSTQHLEGRREP
jgi:hypothetical protein